MAGTNFSAPLTSTVKVQITNDSGNAMLAYGTKPSSTAGYAAGCIFIDTTSGMVYANTGSTTSCTFTKITAI